MAGHLAPDATPYVTCRMGHRAIVLGHIEAEPQRTPMPKLSQIAAFILAPIVPGVTTGPEITHVIVRNAIPARHAGPAAATGGILMVLESQLTHEGAP